MCLEKSNFVPNKVYRKKGENVTSTKKFKS